MSVGGILLSAGQIWRTRGGALTQVLQTTRNAEGVFYALCCDGVSRDSSGFVYVRQLHCDDLKTLVAYGALPEVSL